MKHPSQPVVMRRRSSLAACGCFFVAYALSLGQCVADDRPNPTAQQLSEGRSLLMHLKPVFAMTSLMPREVKEKLGFSFEVVAFSQFNDDKLGIHGRGYRILSSFSHLLLNRFTQYTIRWGYKFNNDASLNFSVDEPTGCITEKMLQEILGEFKRDPSRQTRMVEPGATWQEGLRTSDAWDVYETDNGIVIKFGFHHVCADGINITEPHASTWIPTEADLLEEATPQ